LLIIFDLDDTLVDTSGTIAPHVLKNALKRLVSEGLQLPRFESAYQMLLRINRLAKSSKEAVEEFLEMHEAPHLASAALKEIYEAPSLDCTIMPVDQAISTLKTLSQDHHLAIVTAGKEEVQLKKLEKAGFSS